MTEINRNNLPVLYTIPNWKMRIKFKSGYKYYIPELDEYVIDRYLSRTLNKLNIDLQSWYDRWFMNITSLSDRPRCQICSSPAKWKGMINGYGRLSCFNTECESDIKRINKSNALIKRYSNPDERLKESLRQKKRYENQAEREKTSIAGKLAHKKDPTISKRIGESNRKSWLSKTESERELVRNNQRAAAGTEESKLRKSIAQKKSYRDNPDRGRKLGEKNRQFYVSHPEIRRQISSKVSQYYIDNPEARAKVSNDVKNRWLDPTDAMLENGCGPRGIISKSYSIWEDKEIKFDSSWEVHFFESCVNLSVDKLLRCPFGLRYLSPVDNEIHTYLPDFLLNDRYLIEIKPNYLIHDPVNQAKFHAASIYCSDHNLSYVIITEDYLFHNGSPYYGSLPFTL